jgi:4-carboxymuconolactone decarboxylase
MTENEPSGAQKMFGGFAPKLAQITDDVLFGDVWERSELASRDRSLVTITALIAGGNSEQLEYHINLGRQNGLTEDEIKEAIIHLAFYTGWPKAITAIMIAKNIFANPEA